jgi:ribose transport system ATP-binding protein
MTAALLSTTAVAKSFGPVVALRSVDLSVAPGEIHALLGANGAGKSTLVKILAGVHAPTSGTVMVDGQPVRLSRPGESRRHGLATVFQDPALVPDLTVLQNLKLSGADIAEVRRRLAEMGLDGLDLTEQVADVPLPFLRMIDLARATATDPRLLLLDEITAALPPDLSERVFAVMAQQKARDRSVLFISHRLLEVREHCDMCTVLRDGRQVASFDPRARGEGAIIEAMLGESASVVRDEVRARAVEARETEAEVATRAPRLEVRNLAAGRQLEDVSFAVRPGEILGLAALEGQGQDVLFSVLAGQRRPDSGEVVVDGRPLRARTPFDAIQKGVVLVPSDRVTALLPQRSVRENLSAPLYNRVLRWGGINGRREAAAVDDATRRLTIDLRAAAQVRRLSGGNQQKVTIGRWLVGGFSTLLLFDPTRGIDIGTKHLLYDLIRELADTGAAVVMFTSELREVSLLCDRVAVLHAGRVVAELPPETSESDLLSAAHGLDVAA